MAEGHANDIPACLASGLEAEALALHALRLEKNTEVWRPSAEQVASAEFRRIVGEPRYTARGLVRGTVLDSVAAEFSEIKSGASPLDSSYQLRLQTYRSVVEKRGLTVYTNRPLSAGLGRRIRPHGVAVKPLPPEPEP